MKTVNEMFDECAATVEEQFPTADASEKLRAALGLVELTMRGVVEAFNQKRWEEGTRTQVQSPAPAAR